jgi:hypothetical protein
MTFHAPLAADTGNLWFGNTRVSIRLALAAGADGLQFRVESPDGARCLTIVRGADFETMVRAASRPASGPGLPEAAAPTPDEIARLARLCAGNGIEIVGPPLA